MSDDPRDWLGKRVECRYTDGRLHAVGEMIAYSDRPTVVIRDDSGAQVSWVAHLTRLADWQEVEENHEAIVMAEMDKEREMHTPEQPGEFNPEANVPRRAMWADLRPGAWVALFDENHARAGRIRPEGHPGRVTAIPFPKSDGASGFDISDAQCGRGEVVLLQEAPAAPVTVRREDLDRLAEMVAVLQMEAESDRRTYGNLAVCAQRVDNAARALIDNAEVEQ